MWLARTSKSLLPFALAAACVGLLLFLIPSLHTDPGHPAVRLAKSALAQGSSHFAIADFDGDLRPDLAMIRVRQDGAPDAQYSLELQFSSGLRAPIGLIGPAGGLDVSPQDVNGDQIADLVITSVVDSQFVAIFLNDGKGNFTQVDRAAYPEVGKRPGSVILAPSASPFYELAVGQSRWQLSGQARCTFGQPFAGVSSFLATAFEQTPRNAEILLQSGRAPPLA